MHESCFLSGDVDHTESVLLEAGREFGASLWLAEAQINYLQTFRGYNEQIDFANELSIERGTHPLIRFIISWISSRASQRITPSEFFDALDDVVPIENGFAALTHVVLGQHQLSSESIASSALAYADIFPAIDRYLLTISVIQAIITSVELPAATIEILRDELVELSRRIPDPITARLLTFLGAERAADSTAFPLIEVQDLYVCGNYRAAFEKASACQSKELSVEALYFQLSSASKGLIDLNLFQELPSHSPIKSIAADLQKLIAFDNEADESAKRLSKLALTSSNCSWASTLSLIVSRYYRDDRLSLTPASSYFHALRCQHELPSFAFLSRHNLTNGYQRTLEHCTSSPTCALILATLKNVNWQNELLLSIPDDRLIKWKAIGSLRSGRWQDAVEILTPIYERSGPAHGWPDAGRLLAAALIELNELHRCCEVSVELFSFAQSFASLLPIKNLLSKLIQASEKLQEPTVSFFGSLVVVLTFDIYSRFVSSEYDAYKADAFKDFLAANYLSFASEIVNTADRFPRNQLVQFLKHVCIPEVLDQSLALISTKAVEDERVRILVLLSELTSAEGKPPSSDLLEELSAIKTRQVVRDTTLQLDQSRVYVNVDGIRKTVSGSMRETWRRYQLLTHQQRSTSLEELQKLLETALGERIAVLSLSLPLTESNKLFARMVYELRDMFSLSREFGLDANLSTNIRHGFVMREIRGPLLSHHLVTNKDSAAGNYQLNTYWLERLDDLPSYAVEELMNGLALFSEQVDAQIEYLNRHMIRIRTDQAKEGLFDYTIDDVGIQLLKRRCDKIQEFDDFFDEVIAALWALTNRGLDSLREMLSSSILTNLLSALQSLQDILHRYSYSEGVSGLLSATNLVRPDLRSAIDRVASWFAIPSNNEYQDYDLRIAYEAGLATIKSYYSHLSIFSEFGSEQSILMAGRTLPSFVRLFSLLLDNCAFHSGLAGGSLRIKVEAAISKGFFGLRVKNNLGYHVDLDLVRAKAATINAEFGRERASQLIPVEGGSGYPKIWKILAHDLGGKHALEVSVSEDREFVVDILLDSKGLVL